MQSFTKGTPAGRRYVVRTLAFMVPYVALMVLVMGGAFDDVQGTTAGWLLAAAAAAPVIGQIWATLSLMNDSDEFVREVTARQFIAAAGMAMAIAALWGFGEEFAGAPHLSAWLVYPLFWGCFGLVAPFIRSTR
jgi:hypothetical protein